jgi:hypothetical protein
VGRTQPELLLFWLRSTPLFALGFAETGAPLLVGLAHVVGHRATWGSRGSHRLSPLANPTLASRSLHTICSGRCFLPPSFVSLPKSGFTQIMPLHEFRSTVFFGRFDSVVSAGSSDTVFQASPLMVVLLRAVWCRCSSSETLGPERSRIMAPRIGRQAFARLLFVVAMLCSSCMSLTGLPPSADDEGASCADGNCKYPMTKVCAKPTMHALAKDLDCLEEHIDKFGSVVAKQPDIWGQARLTKYRQDFENQMAPELSNFGPTLQGALTRSDQAYAADAFALSAAISSQQAGAEPPTPVMVQQHTTTAGATPVTPTAIAVPAATPQTDVFSGFSAIKRTDPISPALPGFAVIGKNGISLEPTTLLDQKARYLDHLNQIRRNNEGDDTVDSPGYSLNLVRIPISVLPGKCTQRGHGAEITFTLKPYLSDELLPTTFRNLVTNDLVDMLALPVTKATDSTIAVTARAIYANDKNAYASALGTAIAQGPVAIRASANQRSGRQPLPPSDFAPVIGRAELGWIAFTAHQVVDSHKDSNGGYYYLDVQSTLREEIAAAYDMLAPQHRGNLWFRYCTPLLAKAVRDRMDDVVNAARTNFMNEACPPGHSDPTDCPPPTDPAADNKRKVTASLAWAIIVESALLNDRLIQDMHEATAAKGCTIGDVDHLPFFLPNPPPEARTAFNDYVRCRWPIHVFALDPMEQDQNIQDAYSSRREMQLAISLAFVSGNMSANNMFRYARHLEKDMESILINRTQVGFSHGDDTFGWRFYPRFQSPQFQSNLTVFFRDQLWGGPSKKAEMRQEWLEPGIRDSVAIVMMPSFVPYVTCESSSNWFRLGDPKCKQFTTAEAVRLGRKLKGIYTCGPNVQNADCYRDGDLARMMNKAKQLEARLPLQDAKVQVPYENTIGGFEMFNAGVTDLAPQLHGWYGAPGVNPSGDTQLFLVGNHFSVHHTIVSAGGANVPFELISRQVMKVTIPKGTLANCRKGAKPNCPLPKKSATDQGMVALAAFQDQPPGVPGAAPLPSGPPILPPPTPVNVDKPASMVPPCTPPVPAQASTVPPAAPSLPCSPAPDATDGLQYVDVHVATPYGVTPHLEIPLMPPDQPQPGSGPAFTEGTVKVAFKYDGTGIVGASPPQTWPPLAIKWDPKSPLGDPPAATSAKLELTFKNPYSDPKSPQGAGFGSQTAVLTFQYVLDANKQLIVDATTLSNQIVGRFGGVFNRQNPPIQVSTSAKISLLDANGKSFPGWDKVQMSSASALAVTWQEAATGCCPPTQVTVCPTAADTWHAMKPQTGPTPAPPATNTPQPPTSSTPPPGS